MESVSCRELFALVRDALLLLRNLRFLLDLFLDLVREVKAFRVSSLSSAAEQRRFAMTFVERSSGNNSRLKRKTVTDRKKR